MRQPCVVFLGDRAFRWQILAFCLAIAISGSFSKIAAGQSPQQEVVYFLTVFDAQNFNPSRNGPSLQNNPALANPPVCTGAYADGASVLVIRLHNGALAPGGSTLTLSHGTDPQDYHDPMNIGSIYTPVNGNPWQLPPLPAPDPTAIAIANGQLGTLSAAAGAPGNNANNDTYVYYRPPNNFLFGGNMPQQVLLIEAHDANGALLASTTFTLDRPMVVLGHGINSSSSALTQLQTSLQVIASGGVDVELFDWSQQNTSGFDTVAGLLNGFVTQELQNVRAIGTAATRVDYFGHSMGGVVAKWYAGATAQQNFPRSPRWFLFPRFNWQPSYIRDNNFGIGDFHRLISVGSPYSGSPLADLTTFRTWPAVMLFVGATPGLHGNGCCYYDLGTRSRSTSVLIGLTPTVSWFPIVGIGAPGKTSANLSESWVVSLLSPLVNQLCTNVGLLPANSDLIVRDLSQLNRPTDQVRPKFWSLVLAQNQVPAPIQSPGLPWNPIAGIAPPAGSSSFIVVRNVTHSDELSSVFVAIDVAGPLDLGASIGNWVFFNPGF